MPTENPFADLIPAQPQQRTPGFIPGRVDPYKQRSEQRAESAEARAARGEQRTEVTQDRTNLNSDIDNLVKLRKEFEGNAAVQDYKTILPQITAAMRADDNGAGDLSVIYAFGKVMDPGSAVREGEMAMAGSTTPLMQMAEQWRLRIEKGQRMPPAIRRQLIMEMRRKGGDLNTRYMQERARYGRTARSFRVNPADVIGDHPGKDFQQTEADYLGRPIRNADGTQGARPRQKKAWTPPAGWSIEEVR